MPRLAPETIRVFVYIILIWAAKAGDAFRFAVVYFASALCVFIAEPRHPQPLCIFRALSSQYASFMYFMTGIPPLMIRGISEMV